MVEFFQIKALFFYFATFSLLPGEVEECEHLVTVEHFSEHPGAVDLEHALSQDVDDVKQASNSF